MGSHRKSKPTPAGRLGGGFGLFGFCILLLIPLIAKCKNAVMGMDKGVDAVFEPLSEALILPVSPA
jgi:hypothetical protein